MPTVTIPFLSLWTLPYRRWPGATRVRLIGPSATDPLARDREYALEELSAWCALQAFRHGAMRPVDVAAWRNAHVTPHARDGKIVGHSYKITDAISVAHLRMPPLRLELTPPEGAIISPRVLVGHSTGPGGAGAVVAMDEAPGVEGDMRDDVRDVAEAAIAAYRARATGASEQRPPRREQTPKQRVAAERNWRTMQLRGMRTNLLSMLFGQTMAPLSEKEANGVRAALAAIEALPGVVPPPARDPETGYY